ncbi:MAG: efflux RND transporter permease subunit, partial [Myxococcales bacterium]|nr:efflux RND transporter permease subunit [Myxococcales bacterium]
MLEAILAWSIRRRAVVLLGAVALLVAGALSFHALPIDAFPDTTPVQVQINTTAPALGPLEIERQISAPIEQAISGLPGLVEVRSVSRFGF